MTERTWVTFTDVEQLRPGRRMRTSETDADTKIVEQIRLLRGCPNILFTDRSGLDIQNARCQRWQIEV